MRAKKLILLAGIAVAVLAGCNKAPEPKTATGADPTPGSTPAVSSGPPGGSVALPENKMPQPDSSIPSASAAKANSGDANTPNQANPAALQKSQEQASLPHSGQVNNHSVPETLGTVK